LAAIGGQVRMNDVPSTGRRPVRVGFRTTIITVFVAAVLFVGLTLVYLSFPRTSLELGGSRREITVLFTDVVDFTAKTEKADPSQVMIYTSRYFAAPSEEIMSRQGTVDKFVGDAVMAFWNAPADDPDHITNACRAVLACIRRNAELNTSFRSEGWRTARRPGWR
jgi:class 3 adenylate cyclase